MNSEDYATMTAYMLAVMCNQANTKPTTGQSLADGMYDVLQRLEGQINFSHSKFGAFLQQAFLIIAGGDPRDPNVQSTLRTFFMTEIVQGEHNEISTQ